MPATVTAEAEDTRTQGGADRQSDRWQAWLTGTAAVLHTWRAFWAVDAVPYGCAGAIGVGIAVGLFALGTAARSGAASAAAHPVDASLLRFLFAALAASTLWA